MEPTKDQIDDAILHDRRFAAIDMGVTMAAELRDSRSLAIFLSALAQEAQDCLVAFGNVNAADPAAVMPLQVRVRAMLFLNETIEQVMNTAKLAEQHILAESENTDDR